MSKIKILKKIKINLKKFKGESTLYYNQKQYFGIFVQLFSILITLLGIPLLLIHLENSIKTIFAFCEDNFERPNLAIIGISIGTILIISLFIDIILEEEKDYFEFNEEVKGERRYF